MNARKQADKIAYFFIAFAVYLLIRAFSTYLIIPLVNVLLSSFSARSPRLSIPHLPLLQNRPLYFL